MNVVSAVRSGKANSGTSTAVVTMSGGTVDVRGEGVTVGTCSGNNLDGFLWGPNTEAHNIQGTWTMTGGLITCGTFNVGTGSTVSNSIFNLNGGTVISESPAWVCPAVRQMLLAAFL